VLLMTNRNLFRETRGTAIDHAFGHPHDAPGRCQQNDGTSEISFAVVPNSNRVTELVHADVLQAAVGVAAVEVQYGAHID
jgi:hypothetical protein